MAIQTTLGLTITVGDDQNSTALVVSPGATRNNTPASLIYAGILNEYIQSFTIGVATPSGLALVAFTTGGSLAAATYYWKVTGLNATGETVGSNEVTATTTGSTSSVTLSWQAMPGATSYRIYRGTTTGSEDHYQASSTNSFTDTGATGTSGTVPVSNTTGTTWTPTLPMTPLQVVYVRNLPTSPGTLTPTITPTGGSAAALPALAPGAVLTFLEPSVVSGGGITAISFAVSAQGTTVEAIFTA
jgi:hypothetical protein